MAEGPTTKTIDTPSGVITTTTQTVEPTPQEITVASPEDVRAIDAFASQAESFVATYLSRRPNPSLQDFDEAFRL